MRLRRSDCDGPGIIRKGRGRGFEYFDRVSGDKVTEVETLRRIRGLVIPPAWRDVWVCPHPNGHLQAVGTDAAGRRQYRCHDQWRQRRDGEKFDRMLSFAEFLPDLRQACATLLASDELDRERVLACAVRLLDYGFFRIGSEQYAAEHDSFGLATIRRSHVTVRGSQVVFDYPAKGGKQRALSLVDDDVRKVVNALRRRRGGGPELLAYRENNHWVDVSSRDINDFIKERCGTQFSAKDFRT